MKEFVYGKHKITRRSIPAELSDLSTWPSVDVNVFSKKDLAAFEDRAEAIRLFVENPEIVIAEIFKITGVWAGTLYCLLS